MASWRESLLVLARLAELHSAGERCALATVIRVNGSAYRRPGARLLVEANGATTGNVSGGCLEMDVREVALQVMRHGRTERRTYCSSGDAVSAWDLGVGCEGEVEVLIEAVRDGWDDVRALMSLEQPFMVSTVLPPNSARRRVTALPAREGHAEGGSGITRDASGAECFVDCFIPAPRLVIVGAGHDAQPLAQMALAAGLRVTVLDHRAGLLVADRFPGEIRLVNRWPEGNAFDDIIEDDSLAVLMTHSYADDLAYLRELVATPVRYIGLLGPRQRTERLMQKIGTADDPRIHGPIGLDIGGEGAAQIAVAILAQLLAVSAGRSAEPLRDRTAPIHAAER